MRSCRELLLVALLAGCGTDYVLEEPPPRDDGETPIAIEPDACETSYLTYDTFGEPFMLNWCRGCHSSSIPAGMRQKAPAAVNFDTLEDVRARKDRVAARAASVTATMPPVGGPTIEERELLAEWIACGVR
jgi:hypothetical protein